MDKQEGCDLIRRLTRSLPATSFPRWAKRYAHTLSRTHSGKQKGNRASRRDVLVAPRPRRTEQSRVMLLCWTFLSLLRGRNGRLDGCHSSGSKEGGKGGLVGCACGCYTLFFFFFPFSVSQSLLFQIECSSSRVGGLGGLGGSKRK